MMISHGRRVDRRTASSAPRRLTWWAPASSVSLATKVCRFQLRPSGVCPRTRTWAREAGGSGDGGGSRGGRTNYAPEVARSGRICPDEPVLGVYGVESIGVDRRFVSSFVASPTPPKPFLLATNGYRLVSSRWSAR
jgi:hypothetical protein